MSNYEGNGKGWDVELDVELVKSRREAGIMRASCTAYGAAAGLRGGERCRAVE